MKRVSSRQRLVSWDAFDASAPEELDSSEPDMVLAPSNHDVEVDSFSNWSDEFEAGHIPQSSPPQMTEDENVAPLKRKRIQTPRTQAAVVNLIPSTSTSTLSSLSKSCVSDESFKTSVDQVDAYAWEVGSVCTSTSATTFVTSTGEDIVRSADPLGLFSSLNDDIQLTIVSYLDLTDIDRMRQASSKICHLLQTQDADHFWKRQCQQVWAQGALAAEDTKYSPKKDWNFAQLLHLAPGKVPLEIDQGMFAPCRWSRSLRRQRLRVAGAEDAVSENGTIELKMVTLPKAGGTAVTFTGTIGTGDRCVRSQEPWPKPSSLHDGSVAITCSKKSGPLSRLLSHRSTHLQHRSNHSRASRHSDDDNASFLGRFRRSRERRHGSSNSGQQVKDSQVPGPLEFRPFVIPYCVKVGEYELTPRLVHYYEVAILKPQSHLDEQVDTGSSLRPELSSNASECVAVGLSCPEFSLHTRMPGWDSWSYGYHGDDGGVFFGTGSMLRPYGPTFGVGDVVGCGLDYHSRHIFFTLNGRYLGPAWRDLSDDVLQRDWFPTVGMDTHCLVQCNFGVNAAAENTKPFAFDLTQYIQKHHEPSIDDRRKAGM